MKKLLARSLVLISIGLGPWIVPSVHADLIAYEGFEYDTGVALGGLNGGFGFSDAWYPASATAPGISSIQAGGLGFSSLTTSGGALYVAGDATAGTASFFRTLATPRGDDGTTTWLSFIGQRTGTKSANYGVDSAASYVRPLNLSLYNSTLSSGQERLALGEGTRTSGGTLPDTDVWGLVERGGVNNALTTWTTVPVDVQSFVLVRIDHGAANADTGYMWLNPDLSVEPAVASALVSMTGIDLAFDRIRPFAGNPSPASQNIPAEGYFDEIRVGTTFADVAPLIPEPSTVALFALGGLSFLLLRRRV